MIAESLEEDRVNAKKTLCSFTRGQLAEIDEVAKLEHRNRSDTIREACRHYVRYVKTRDRIAAPESPNSTPAWGGPSYRGDAARASVHGGSRSVADCPAGSTEFFAQGEVRRSTFIG